MNREFSAGGVVINDQNQILLVKISSIKSNKQFWGFPKGHPNEGESMKNAALREVKEETGIEAEIIQKVGDSQYVFEWEGQKIFKIVTIYLMKYLSGELQRQEEEVIELGWFSPDEARKTLSFSKDKAILKKALEMQNGG